MVSDTRFRLAQPHYAGSDPDSGSGYIEVLTIEDAPPGHTQFIFHQWNSEPRAVCTFFECSSLEQATEAFNLAFGGLLASWKWSGRPQPNIYRLVRSVEYRHPKLPWFYAKNGDELDGDFVRPYSPLQPTQ